MNNYKLVVIPAVERTFDNIDFYFITKEEMDAAHDAMAKLLLYLQDDIKVMYDFSNIFERFMRDSDGNWIEID